MPGNGHDPVSDAIRAGIFTRVVGQRLLHFARLPSTMDEAHRQVAGGCPEGTVIVAEEQTKGRGRMGHAWMSPPGNLYLSVVLRPHPSTMPYLAMMTTVAVVKALRQSAMLDCTVKWPNDVRRAGRKLCGVIVESAVSERGEGYAVLGIGLNVNMEVASYPEIRDTATSVRAEAGHEVPRSAVLRSLLEALDRAYAEVRRGGSPRDEWREVLETLGQRVRVRWRDEVHEGVAEDVDAAGNLLLRRSDGSLAVLSAGEVTSQV